MVAKPITGPWWDRVGIDKRGFAYDATFEPIRRIRNAVWYLGTKGGSRIYHSLHMIITGEF